jgi:hypothetical protein
LPKICRKNGRKWPILRVFWREKPKKKSFFEESAVKIMRKIELGAGGFFFFGFGFGGFFVF